MGYGLQIAKFLKEMDLRKLTAFTEALGAITALKAMGMLSGPEYVECFKWSIIAFFAANGLVHMAKAAQEKQAKKEVKDAQLPDAQ